MRKIFFIIFICLSTLNTFSEDYFWNQKWADIIKDGVYDFNDGKRFIIKVTEKLSGNKKWSSFYTVVDKEQLTSDSDGFIRTTFFGGKQIMMYGGNWVIFSSKTKPRNVNHYFPHLDNTESFSKGWIYSYSGVKNVTSKSFLSEKINYKVVKYNTDDLNRNLIFDSMISFLSRWNNHKVPWVEGEDGPGIGVTLDIEFEEESDHLLVINGYVDFEKTYLYKANNRVKDAVIRSLDPGNKFEIDIHFDDVVRFHEFRFPAKSKKVQFEIRSVYKGEKWDDTAITGFQLRNPENMYDRWKDDFLENAVEYEDWMEFEN